MKVLSDRTAADLVRHLRAFTPLPTRRARIVHGGSAVQPVSAGVCPAVILNDSGVPGVYNVSLYPNGIGGPGRSFATVSMTEFGVENDLPSGTIVLAHAIAIAAAEDGEE